MIKDFIQLQPTQWRILYSQYATLKSQQIPPEEIKLALTTTLSQTFHTEVATLIADKVYTSFSSDLFMSNFYIRKNQVSENANETNDSTDPVYTVPEAYLTVYDIKALKERLSMEDPSSPDTLKLARLLTSFIIYARANPHPSNWIKYDRKVIMYLASLSKNRVADQTILTNRLHTDYNLEMRVVGSSQPIPCFNITWLYALQPLPDTPENPLISIGPLLPETVSNFVSKNILTNSGLNVKYDFLTD